jgi:hypothetical protein
MIKDEGGRMKAGGRRRKDEGGRMKAKKAKKTAYPSSSFILHPSSLILHP